MDKQSANAYIYAKASGILGKSFVESRAHFLFEKKSLGELWTLLNKSPIPSVPEVLLAESIEKKAFSDFINQYTEFVNLYDKPEPILIDQLCIYEAENLKSIGAALCQGEKNLPNLIDLKDFSQFDFSSWPNIEKITRKTQFSWYNKTPSIHEQKNLEEKIDLQVVRHLWNSLNHLSGDEFNAVSSIFKYEFVMKNIVWALRLKLFYKMKNEEIIENLIFVTEKANVQDPIVKPVLQILEFPVDDFKVWSSWKYKDLINPFVSSDFWEINPSWIEGKSRTKLNRMAINVFHSNPMSIASLIGWYKIKNYELNCIRTAVESLRLSVDSEIAMKVVGVTK